MIINSPIIRVRFAPSPTGFVHIGSLHTVLYNYLFAAATGGVFVLRIEDTDRERLVAGAAENLLRVLEKLGIIPDEGVQLDATGAIYSVGPYAPYIQSERLQSYRTSTQRLLDGEHAYYCFCSKERLELVRESQIAAGQQTHYDGACRDLDKNESAQRVASGESAVVRARMTQTGETIFTDLIRGTITFVNSLQDDFVIMKTDGFPTYHLASVVDDAEMRITDVIRGEEWISSVPKHLFLYSAFGWQPPRFAHVTLLLNADRSKLSKRQGDVSVESFLDRGFVPGALINFIAILGWNPKSNQEIYSLSELVSLFRLEDVGSAPAVFDEDKLRWMNHEYLQKMSFDEKLHYVENGYAKNGFAMPKISQSQLSALVELEIERAHEYADIGDDTMWLRGYTHPEKNLLVWKKSTAKTTEMRLRGLADALSAFSFASRAQIETDIKILIEREGWGNGDTLWPLRVALTSVDKSPDPFSVAFILGKEETIRRIHEAVKICEK